MPVTPMEMAERKLRDRFLMMKIKSGEPPAGAYPPRERIWAEYQTWRKRQRHGHERGNEMTGILLSPEGHSEERHSELAVRRLTTLDGATVGLLGNTKLNADAILAAIGALLGQRYALETVVARTKPSFSHPALPSIVDEMVAKCDVVIAGVGD